MGFVGYRNGNWQLSPTSKIKRRATDGKDPGVDFQLLDPRVPIQLCKVVTDLVRNMIRPSKEFVIPIMLLVAMFAGLVLVRTSNPQSPQVRSRRVAGGEGKTIEVSNGQNLQSAINSANCGDSVVLQSEQVGMATFCYPTKNALKAVQLRSVRLVPHHYHKVVFPLQTLNAWRVSERQFLESKTQHFAQRQTQHGGY